MSDKRQLMIGAGEQRKKGWVSLDASPKYSPDILAEVPPLPPEVRDTQWDTIEMFHCIEHHFLWRARVLLQEIYNALKPGGMLILEQPNIEYCAKVLLGQVKPPKGDPGQFDMWGFYGDPNHLDQYMCHHWGYTPESLRAELILAGWKDINITLRAATSHHPVRDFRLEAVK